MGRRLLPPALLGALLLVAWLAAHTPAVSATLPGLDAEGEEWEASLGFCQESGQFDEDFQEVCAQILGTEAAHAVGLQVLAAADADADEDKDAGDYYGYGDDDNEERETEHSSYAATHEDKSWEDEEQQDYAVDALGHAQGTQHLEPASGWRAAGIAHSRRLHQQQQQEQGESAPSLPPSGDIAAAAPAPAPAAVAGGTQATFTLPGTYNWVPPSGVTQINVVCIGAGGGAGSYHPALWGTPQAGGAGGGGGERVQWGPVDAGGAWVPTPHAYCS
jgi:hypothetical protein